MNRRKESSPNFMLLATIFLSFILGMFSYSKSQTLPQSSVAELEQQQEVQWIWGEVESIDIQKKELLVKYLDYEVDQEKEITIGVDEKTIYENIKSLDELKPKDTVSVDYVVSPQGKNIAKVLSVERPEEAMLPFEEQEDIVPESTPQTKKE